MEWGHDLRFPLPNNHADSLLNLKSSQKKKKEIEKRNQLRGWSFENNVGVNFPVRATAEWLSKMESK